MNGAQVTSMVDVVSSVSAGEIPRDTGIKILETAFGLTHEVAEELLGDAGTNGGSNAE